MRINRDHPLLKGCRFFAIPDNTGTMRNLMGGADGTVANAPAIDFLGAHPALDYAQASSQAVTFGTYPSYGFEGPDVTVIFRARPDAYGTTDSINYVVCSSDAGATAGWDIGFMNFGGALEGWVFQTFSAGNTFTSNDGTGAAPLTEQVVGVTYRNSTRSSEFYLNGGKPNITTNAGLAWDVTGSDPIYIGRRRDGRYFDGAIGWVAIFDRSLSEREHYLWSRDWEWPFFDDDGGELYSTEISYASVVSAQGFYTVVGLAGVVSYSTSMEALGSFGGELVVEPEPGEVAFYESIVGCREVYTNDVPTLAFYSNVTNATATYSVQMPVFYENITNARGRYTGLLDGRLDLIDTSRYRR